MSDPLSDDEVAEAVRESRAARAERGRIGRSARTLLDEALRQVEQLRTIQALTGATDDDMSRMHAQAVAMAARQGRPTSDVLADVAELIKYPPTRDG